MRVLVLPFVATLFLLQAFARNWPLLGGALIRVASQKLTVRCGQLIGCAGLKQFWGGKKLNAVVGL